MEVLKLWKFEGYYEFQNVQSMNDMVLGTAYTAYMNGQPAFTVYLYDNNPNMMNIHEMVEVEANHVTEAVLQIQ